MDFTIVVYKKLLNNLLSAGYKFITFEEYMAECEKNENSNIIILRHDVDLKAENSLATAIIENSLGIKATYYFRIVKQSNQPDIISKIRDLGHEIGYHYENLSDYKGDFEQSWFDFNTNLEYFRTYYPVKTVCMHGSPMSKYDNRKLWEKYSYRNLDIIGEPYLDFIKDSSGSNYLYFTDTGRSWCGDRYNIRDKFFNINEQTNVNIRFTKDLSKFLVCNYEKFDNMKIMITTHPQRWTDNKFQWLKEILLQNIKNTVKLSITSMSKFKKS